MVRLAHVSREDVGDVGDVGHGGPLRGTRARLWRRPTHGRHVSNKLGGTQRLFTPAPYLQQRSMVIYKREAFVRFGQRLASLVAGTLAAGFALPSLVQPFGPDQALYYYVGREWALRGSVPYRDVYDHKTPLLYLAHAVLVLLTGQNEWAIRAAEIALAVLISVAVASYGGWRRARSDGGWRYTFSALLVCGLYYAYFDFWTTGQTEIWCLAPIVWAMHRARRRRFLAAGLLLGIAFVAKPPSLAFSLPLVILIATTIRRGQGWRWWTGVARALGRFFAAALVAPVLTLAYFMQKRALPDMFDIVVGANSYYVAHDARAHTLSEYLRAFTEPLGRFRGVLIAFVPIALFVIGVAVFGRKRGARVDVRRGFAMAACRDLLVGVSFAVAAIAAVAVQKKFFWLHWAVLVGPLAFVLVQGMSFVSSWRPKTMRLLVSVLTTVATLVALAHPDDFTWDYWKYRTERAVKFASGGISKDEFYSGFYADVTFFYLKESREVADYVRSHAKPEDRLLARAFQPHFYSLTKLYYGGRFYWSNFLTDPKRAHRRDEYLKEDESQFLQIKPRWVIVPAYGTGLEGNEWFTARACRLEKVFSRFSVLDCSDARKRSDAAP